MKFTQNGVAVIGIDHGYGNIKTANSVTLTGVTAYDSKPTFEGNIVHYDGVYYKIGENRKSFIADKDTDRDNYILTLFGIARELSLVGKTEASVHIAAGLPLAWVKEQRERFRRYLTQNSTVEFDLDNKHYNIRIVGCSVYPQGYTAVINRLHEMNGVNMIADIGCGTLDIMYINNKKATDSKCWTEKLGVSKCVTMMKNAVMDKFHSTLYDETAEEYIRYGKADVSERHLKVMYATVREYCKMVLDTLYKYDYDPELMKLYIVGGGSCILKNFACPHRGRVYFISDVCAAAKGYEYLAVQQLQNNGRR